MYLPHVKNEKTVTVIVDGKCEIISASHINYEKIRELLDSGDHSEVIRLINIPKAVSSFSLGSVNIVGNDVLYHGRKVPRYQSQKILDMYRVGSPSLRPFERMVARVMENISARAQEEFPRFADDKGFPIDEDGYVYAWRGLQDDFWSRNGNPDTRVLKGKVNAQGQIYNGVGEEIEVERADVDDDCNRTCSYGVHVGSLEYAKWWSRGKVVLVKFDPKDVVSVPAEAGGDKCRVCHYWVVSEYTEETPIKEPVISTLNPDERKIKARIDRYVTNRKNEGKPVPSFKQIQSALKTKGLKVEDIKRIIRAV